MMLRESLPYVAARQQTRRSLWASRFEAIVNDLRVLLHKHAGRDAEYGIMILDNRTV